MILVIFFGVIAWSCSKKMAPSNPVSIPADPVAKDTSKELAIEIAAGSITYTSKCGRCHEHKAPGEFTLQEWDDIMEKMARKAHLNASEKSNVLAYLHANAKK